MMMIMITHQTGFVIVGRCSQSAESLE